MNVLSPFVLFGLQVYHSLRVKASSSDLLLCVLILHYFFAGWISSFTFAYTDTDFISQVYKREDIKNLSDY